MTDELPRRGYPLVVPPPGGFEDAVRRGRSLRRRRAGGSSGIALVLAGALAYSVLGGGNGVSRVDMADQNEADKRERSAPAQIVPIGPSATPRPAVSPAGVPRAGTVPTPAPGSVSGARPTVGPSSTVVVNPTRKPGTTTQGRKYARRSPIERDEPMTNTDIDCISRQTDWCASANVQENAAEGMYVLSYTLCRAYDATPGTLTFDWQQEVDFSTTDNAHDDTVWTYSAGVKRVRDEKTYTIQPRSCVTWHTVWNGYDDFGYTPPQGTYTLVAQPLTREELPQAQWTFQHA